METLRKQIRRAQSRLVFTRFLERLCISLSVTLLLALLAVVARKLWPLDVAGPVWAWSAIGLALGGGLLAALGWTVRRHASAIEAAIEIDRRFGLKERISSSLALTPAELESPAGRALLDDARKRADRLDVAGAFRVRPGRLSLLPLGLGLAVFAAAFLIGDRGAESKVDAKTAGEQAQQAKKSVQSLEKKLAERREMAHEQGLEDAADLLKKIEQGAKELADKSDVDRKRALVELNDLAKDLEKRRDKLAADEKLKQQFNQLKDLDRGPADKLGQALKRADFKQAAQELKALKDKLDRQELAEKDREALAQQLDDMKQSLDKLAQAQQDAKRELEKQIAQAQQAGNMDEAQKAQQQLDKLNQDSASANKMSQMAQKLGQASKALKQQNGAGDQQAKQALDDAAGQLAELDRASQEMQMLDEALDEMAQAKGAMGCKSCNGEGCAQCQGGKAGQKAGQNGGQKNGQMAGNGLGRGRGQGDRPERDNPTGFYDSSVRQNVGRGGAVASGTADGPNRKGELREEIKSSLTAARHDAADPLSGQRLPREYREHAKTYFDSIREGQK